MSSLACASDIQTGLGLVLHIFVAIKLPFRLLCNAKPWR